jgi:HK97 gp10 family phage protein
VADIDISVVTNIEGLDEFEADLIEGGPRAAKKFLRRIGFKAAKILVDAAEQAAPYRTGELEGDIHRQTVTDSAEGTLTVRVGPSKATWYGLVQEIGAPDENIPALHWLENSARSVQNEVLDEYMNATTEALEGMKSK